jgi:nucleoside-diphosphate-sugar epimerase
MADKLVIGCGYLGRRVAALWLAQGHRVWATTRRPDRAEEWRRQGLLPVLCDVLAPESLQALPAVETVVYCVGADRSAGQPPRRVHVGGPSNVLAALLGPGSAKRPERFVYVSSTSVYGQSQGEEVDETAPTAPTEETGRVVLEAEGLLRERLPGAIVLRFAGIYGPERLIRAEALRVGTPLTGDPDTWLNLIQVEDGAAAVLAAGERGVPGTIYNVADDHPVRRREFYTRLAELLGAPAPRFVPANAVAVNTNRRIGNRRLRRELGVPLRYPSCAEGLPASR